MEPLYEYQLRLILIGDSTVGKSSLLKYFTEGAAADQNTCDATVGVDFFARLIRISPDTTLKLQLWDTAGQEKFRCVFYELNYHNDADLLLDRTIVTLLESWSSTISLNDGRLSTSLNGLRKYVSLGYCNFTCTVGPIEHWRSTAQPMRLPIGRPQERYERSTAGHV